MGTNNLVFLENLEWFDDTGQELVHRLPEDGSGEIKPGGQGESIARDAGLGAIAGGVLGAVTGKKGDKTEKAAKGAAIGGVLGGIAGAVLHKDQVTLKDGATMNITIVTPVIQKKLKE